MSTSDNTGIRMRLRQVALVASDLSAAEATIEAELGLSRCFRDPGVAVFGLANALFPIGEQLLEVVSPSKAGTTAGRLLEKRGGDGGYMVILQVDDLPPLRRRFEETAARVVFEAVAEGVTGLHLHPSDVGGAILSVDQTEHWDAWPWAGPDWRAHVRPSGPEGISAVEIQANSPAVMAARWAEVLGRPLDDTTLRLDEGEIRFVKATDGRGEGLSGLELVGGPPEPLSLCGVTVSAPPRQPGPR